LSIRPRSRTLPLWSGLVSSSLALSLTLFASSVPSRRNVPSTFTYMPGFSCARLVNAGSVLLLNVQFWASLQGMV